MDDVWTFNGIDARSGSYLLQASPASLAQAARGGEPEPGALMELRNRRLRGANHLGVKAGASVHDLSATGWGVVFPAALPDSPEARRQEAIREALAPLLAHRREAASRRSERYYREFVGPAGLRPGEGKPHFLARHGAGPGPADPEIVPYYLLLVGDPREISFRFQSQLGVQYAVGRLCFDSVEEYAHYARSVVAAETRPLAPPPRLTFFSAANHDDAATQSSSQLLVAPLAQQLAREPALSGWSIDQVARYAATRDALAGLLADGQAPTLLFAAGHGVGFGPDHPLQRRHQGALVCQDWPGPRVWGRRPIPEAHYFAGDHLAADADLVGTVAFLFACYGAGTPEFDEFSAQAFKQRSRIAPEPFVAGLPTAMLGRAKGGALAVIGHVDRAWGHSFLWPRTGAQGQAGSQTAVFASALQSMMLGAPVGAAMEFFDERYAELSSDLTVELEKIEHGERIDEHLLAAMWTANNDARGYAILGDPAVRLRVPGAAPQAAAIGPAAAPTKASREPARAEPGSLARHGVAAEAKYYALHVSILRIADTYHVELSHSDPDSQAQVAPVRGAAAVDAAALRALEATPQRYGEALARQVFADEEVARRFVQVETAAQVSGSFLQIVLCIDLSAQELHGVRWELLRHPRSGAALCTSETIVLSRFMVSRDWRPVKLRARSELVALVAVSAPVPGKLQRMGLAPVDHEGEVRRVRRALAPVEVRVLGGPGSPCTLDRLLEELRRGVDILYVVSHGVFGRSTGAPALVLQDDAGEAVVVKAEDLTVRIGELQRGPRLAVLASCESAGDGRLSEGAPRTTPHASLAGRLADAGVPAVIAMQGLITMATVEKMMPVFFAELLRDGQIDRALAAARGVVRGREDAWMPVLYTRIRGGRLWYTSGFRGDKGEDVWRRLVRPVKNGKVVPIIGPRLLETACGSAHETAIRLAGAHRYPFGVHEWDDLPRVTEFLSVKESRYNVIQAYQDQLLRNLIEQHRGWLPPEEVPPANKKPRLGKLLAQVGDHLRASPNDPHRILSELGASVYVTTNFDLLLERALRAQDRRPQQALTRWRFGRAPRPADEAPIAAPTAEAPLVYHVFGAFGAGADEGLVLTEDDHFDHLISTVSAKLMPAEVESALVDNSLLFLGFRLTDWHFRVLFRMMMSLPGRERLKQYCHVAVQLDPELHTHADVEGAKAYLAEYFGKEANIDIFWGSSEEFLRALRDALAAAGDLSGDGDAQEGDDDAWDF